jgi:hypothetical protein
VKCSSDAIFPNEGSKQKILILAFARNRWKTSVQCLLMESVYIFGCVPILVNLNNKINYYYYALIIS